ncbi:hypothetical protein PYK79_48430 [Streptomyces sp. ID05-04B]|uniref:hypothetical protein n=1 Tax=Streptomyces sp. ID05-04B TaxID=3028661 RepID=UPI0029C5CD89|nr:hypothetical protein [Streptomyces sp. ID05-04B]MDX5569531.1 hypothetical protein [Streptomyces sp. ID05-04B]
MTDQTSTGPARQGSTERCTCGHTKRDHSGRRDHRERYGPRVAGRPWCHACETECIYCPPDPEAPSAEFGPDEEPAPGRTPDEISAAVECAIGLNVDCGGAEGVYRVRDAVLDAIRPELDALAELREVARGYCPACGRGDAAPTVEDWEREKQRADEAEGRLAHLQASSEAAGRFLTRTFDERTQLRAALDRVRALALAQQAEGEDGKPCDTDTLWPTGVLAALDTPEPTAAATQATDGQT